MYIQQTAVEFFCGLCHLEIRFFQFMKNIYLRLILDRSLMLACSNSVNLKSDLGEGVICA